MIYTSRLLGAIVIATTLPAFAAPLVFDGAGANAAGIQATVDNFRASIGGANNGVGGSFSNGRREINWDAVPDGRSAPNSLAANFFNANSPRGAVFNTPDGAQFQVSGNAGAAPVEFDNLNPSYSAIFQVFSEQRLFTSLSNQANIVDVFFFVPGTDQRATVSSFGSVFADVDLASTTSITYRDINGQDLGTYFASTADNGLSFLGVNFVDGQRIGSVRITNGNTAIRNDDDPLNNQDVVVMDDFIYAEPAAIPEPGAILLTSAGLAILPLLARRRKQAAKNQLQ